MITGPSGAGKSGLAAQVLALGAALIADDLTILSRQGAHVLVSAPPDAPAMLEARGLGLVPTPLHPPVALSAIVILAPSAARLPEPEHMAVLETPIPVLRHPYRFDLAAKLRLRPWRGM
ncbi:MAG: serine kinase [Pseudomonadota bacterium]